MRKRKSSKTTTKIPNTIKSQIAVDKVESKQLKPQFSDNEKSMWKVEDTKLNVDQKSDPRTGKPSFVYSFTYFREVNPDGNGIPRIGTPTFTDIIYSYIGLVLPIGELNSEFGMKYGNGGLGILILLIMCVSAVIIFVGGSSITVAFVGFLMYIFKVIKMLGDFKTEDTGKSSKTAEK